jgi:nicotinate-nucleotide adenylyltransferase
MAESSTPGTRGSKTPASGAPAKSSRSNGRSPKQPVNGAAPGTKARVNGRTPKASMASGNVGFAERQARRVGIMGGTFDPIHHGHLVAASEVADRFHLDEVVFVPTGQPWQKHSSEVASAEDRYLMTVIATASNPRFTVSRVDIDRPGPTYTVDTLTDMAEMYGPEADLFFITGADALEKILSWKDTERMFKLAHFVAVTRPGYTLSAEHVPPDAVTLVEVPAMAISSTACRDRVGRGHPVWYLVPDGVVQYIAKRRLYRKAVKSGARVGSASARRRTPVRG